jgi:hypothetical protein
MRAVVVEAIYQVKSWFEFPHFFRFIYEPVFKLRISKGCITDWLTCRFEDSKTHLLIRKTLNKPPLIPRFEAAVRFSGVGRQAHSHYSSANNLEKPG